MVQRILITACALSLTGGCLFADFSYQQESKITGGMMSGMMGVAGAFSRQAREPMRSIVSVKGNRMLNQTGNTAQLIDLDREVITSIDFDKKTYSEITFAEMAQAFERATQKMNESKSSNPDAARMDTNMSASVKETGQTRQIQGMTAREVVLTMEMTATDRQSGQQGGTLVISNMWMAPKVSGYEEIAEFYKRMGQKLSWAPGMSAMAMGRSDLNKGFAQLYRESAKLDGTALLQVVTMRPKLDPETEKKLAEAMAQQQASGAQAQPQQQQQAPTPGAADAAGAAAGAAAASGRLGRLGGLGGLGGFGRRKKQEDPPQQQPSQPQQQAAAAPTTAPGVLMEITTESSGFSTAAIDSSKFNVPTGFKKVESDLAKGMR
jgi:hypothetical protein